MKPVRGDYPFANVFDKDLTSSIDTIKAEGDLEERAR
jgi:hypothetical protein